MSFTTLVWACDAKIRSLCRKEGEGGGSTKEKEEGRQKKMVECHIVKDDIT